MAGRSMVQGAFNGAANGVGVTCPASMVAPSFGQTFLDHDGDPLKWQVFFPSGVNVLAPCVTLDRVSIAGFTGYGVYVTSGFDPERYELGLDQPEMRASR